jgi:hypothetical protein
MFPGVGYLWVPNCMVEQSNQRWEQGNKKGDKLWGEGCEHFMTTTGFCFLNESFLHSGKSQICIEKMMIFDSPRGRYI